MSKAVTSGDTVTLHYVGTFPDGEEFDNSYTRGEPVEVTIGSGMLIPGFDAAVVGMEVGEKRHVEVPVTEAYGEVNPNAFVDVPKASFPNDFPFEAGTFVPLTNEQGGQFIGRLQEVNGDDVRVDLNHPMAGRDLEFAIELVSIQATVAETTSDTTTTTEGMEG
jgi:peptidylprolyl isomerase